MILLPADYATIRALLGADATTLPDATLDLILPIADREIKRLAPGWAGYSGDDLDALKDAARYLTAARVVVQAGAVKGFGFEVTTETPSSDALMGLVYAVLEALGLTFSTAPGFAVQVARSDGYTERAAQ